ncbi:MAG: VIT1/CCC1 transporter family protein [Halobacteriota archaeon]
MTKTPPADKKTHKRIHRAQRMEITEHFLYGKLAKSAKEPINREVLDQIAKLELTHYEQWREATGLEMQPSKTELNAYYWIAKVFGIIFMMKLRDFKIWRTYSSLEWFAPEATHQAEQGMARAKALRSAMDEERLHYMGALVMGLNDAIVEITGAIAGFTIVLQNTTLIALAGLITGVAGSLSMAASEYLEKQTESDKRSPAKAAGYTGGAYLVVAAILVAPYLWFASFIAALVCMLIFAFVIILFFSFYSTFLFDQKFRSRFPQMLAMSFGVAFVAFAIGSLLRVALHVNV